MSRIKEIITKERNQYIFFIILSMVILLFSGILYLSNPLSFQTYFGNLNPLIIIPLIITLGIVVFTYLFSCELYKIYNKENLRGILYCFTIAPILTINVILIDLYFTYPEDINVLFPQSLMFYPTMAYVVEILFHLAALSVLLLFLTSVVKKVKLEKIIWICIVIVSFFEPIFQIIFGSSTEFPLWIHICFGLHLYLFNFIQLSIFKRYDFLSMYLFRLVYYLFWHIIWGYIRLEILF